MARSANSIRLEPEDRVLVIERVFNAPRELVWDAFTKTDHLVNWMGPRNYPAASFEADVRAGGKWRGCLRPVDGGQDLWQGRKYLEVERPSRLVYTFEWDKQNEQDETFETVVTVLLEDQGSKTLMKFYQSIFNTSSNRDGHIRGWNSSFDRLGDLLETLEKRHA
ncbi:MAG: SRPBCC family protein [Rhizomicrobium sp.]